MATLKELKTKIASLKSTQKMTKTMKLVAGSRMRKATLAQENARDYAQKLEELLASVAGSSESVEHPLLTRNTTSGKALLLVVASDRGLCGGFNNNLFRMAKKWTQELQATHPQGVSMSFCGRRAYSFFHQDCEMDNYYEGVTDRPAYDAAAKVAQELMDAYTRGRYDAVYVAYNKFKSALTQIPTFTKLLPIDEQARAQGAQASGDVIYEPAVEALLTDLLPNAVKFRVFNILLENGAGEHAARMAAMDNATRNAGELIDHYTLIHNRERQAAITSELIDIVVGAESL